MAVRSGVDMATVKPLDVVRAMLWRLKMVVGGAIKHVGAMVATLWLIMGVASIIFMGLLFFQSKQIKLLEQQMEMQRFSAQPQSVTVIGGIHELEEFQAFLMPHEDIAEVLRLLISLAASEGLQLNRGEYKIGHDTRGKFVRYKIVLPIQGQASKIEQFILKALAQHKTLALESVQFKRERVDALEVEAKMDWVLITKLPANAVVTPHPSGLAEVRP